MPLVTPTLSAMSSTRVPAKPLLTKFLEGRIQNLDGPQGLLFRPRELLLSCHFLPPLCCVRPLPRGAKFH